MIKEIVLAFICYLVANLIYGFKTWHGYTCEEWDCKRYHSLTAIFNPYEIFKCRMCKHRVKKEWKKADRYEKK